ncbi:hypothetical protein Pelo_4897 [Pelomyxa schiedti]|nr:hypothetical protein Pelo_4897 [Pelomyxa schiedti]
MDYTYRQATTDRKLSAEELLAGGTKMKQQEILEEAYNPALILEMDETMLPFQIVQHGIYATVGSTRVEVPGSTEKRGVTATFTVTKKWNPSSTASNLLRSDKFQHTQSPLASWLSDLLCWGHWNTF